MNTQWSAYFQSISHVCPWSLESYRKGRILFLEYDPKLMAQNDINWSGEWHAIIYRSAPDDPEYLDDLVADMESDPSPNCVYFWSHPDHTKGGYNQSPEPIIIQQCRANLESARAGLLKHK